MILSIGRYDNNVLSFGIRKNTQKKEENKEVTNAINSSLRGVPASYITFRGKEEDDELNLTEDGRALINRALEIAEMYGHAELNPAHIIQASIEETENNLASITEEDFDSGLIESVSTLNRVLNNSTKNTSLSRPSARSFFINTLLNLRDDNEDYLKSLKCKDDKSSPEIAYSKQFLKNLKEASNDRNLKDAYIVLAVAMNTLSEQDITYPSEFIKSFITYGRYKGVEDIQDNYMSIYDKRALEVWNKLALGSNISVTFEDPKEAERITSSIIMTVNSPKHGNFNSENTEIFVFDDSINDQDLYEEISAQELINPDVQKVFLVNLDKLLVNSMAEDGSVNYSNGIIPAIGASGDKTKLIFFQSSGVHYNISREPALKALFKNFVTYSIPPVQTYETQSLINKRTMQGIITPFTKDAKERAIYHASNMQGIFPDKALDLMKRIAGYYGEGKKKITAKDVDEFAQLAYELFDKAGDASKTNIVYDTGKTLSSMYGKETVKKDIEAIIRQIKTGKIGTQGMIIYSQDAEAGSGRKYTAETIAGETKVPFVAIDTSDFATSERDEDGSFVDTPKNAMSRIFSDAKKAARQNQYKTAILYISNFEDFAFSGPYLSGYKQAMSQLTEEMQKAEAEDVNILVIGSTDEYYADAIPQVVRGFNNKLTVDSPAFNNKARREIIENRIKETGLPISYRTRAEKEYLISKLVKLTQWMSFVEVKSLINKTKQIMYERDKKKATMGDFIEAYLQLATGRTSHPDMPEYNKQATTSHECGHATNLEVMNDLLKRKGKPWHQSHDVNFITLDPRGNFLGAVFEGRSENTDYPFEAMFAGLVCSYGGYSCEKLFFGMDGSRGISQDLAQASAEAKRGIESYGFGYNTGKISSAPGIKSGEYHENVFKDMNIILENAKIASDLITDTYRGFNEWFTQKYSKLIGSDDCMVDGDEFRRCLANWKKSLSKSAKEGIDIMEDIVIDIIEASKKGKLYGRIK